MIDVKRYVVVHDCGNVINPMIVDGQIHGGVAHGIGNAFYEKLVYDDNGQLLTASLMDYLLPTALDVPPIRTAHFETPSPLNPLGIKGAGESGINGVGAAIASAIDDAIGIPGAVSPDSRRGSVAHLLPSIRGMSHLRTAPLGAHLLGPGAELPDDPISVWLS